MDTTKVTKGRRRLTRMAGGAFMALFLAAAGTLAGIGPAAAQGIAISPTVITVREALRGGSSSENITLGNTTATEVPLSLTAMGDIAQWITFSLADDPRHAPITQLTVPAQRRVQVTATIAVPPAAGNGVYQGVIEIDDNTPSGKVSGGGSGATVGISAQLAVSATVTGVERRVSSLTDAYVDGAEVGQVQRFNGKVSNGGNVNVQTQVDVKVMKGTTVVAELTSKNENFPVSPGSEDTAYAEWKTDDASPGNYTAKFTVTDVAATPPKVIGTKDVDFRLDPRGTLTRAGTLADLKLVNNPGKGELAQFAAVFSNTGKVDANAVFEGDLYRGDKLVKSIVTPERSVKQGTSATVNFSIELPAGGRYKLVGKSNFEGIVSDPKELQFEIGGSGGTSMMTPVVIGSAVLLVAVALFFWMRRRRRPERGAPATVARLEPRRERLSA